MQNITAISPYKEMKWYNLLPKRDFHDRIAMGRKARKFDRDDILRKNFNKKVRS